MKLSRYYIYIIKLLYIYEGEYEGILCKTKQVFIIIKPASGFKNIFHNYCLNLSTVDPCLLAQDNVP